jgi:hypothetical protein
MNYATIIKKVNKIGKRKGNIFSFIELQQLLKENNVKMPRDAEKLAKAENAQMKKGGTP